MMNMEPYTIGKQETHPLAEIVIHLLLSLFFLVTANNVAIAQTHDVSEKTNLQNQIRQIKSDFEKLDADLTFRSQLLKIKANLLEKRTATLNSDLAKKIGNRTTIRDNIKQLTAQSESLNDELKNLEEQQKRQLASLNDARESMSNISKPYWECADKFGILCGPKPEARSEYIALSNGLDRLGGEINKGQSDISMKQADIDSIKQKIKRLESILGPVELELHSIEEKLVTIHQDISQVNSLKRDLLLTQTSIQTFYEEFLHADKESDRAITRKKLNNIIESTESKIKNGKRLLENPTNDELVSNLRKNT